MNKQEIFDKVALHLLTQGVAAKKLVFIKSSQFCSYWDQETGLKCAIGCLIPEELYNKEMESAGAICSNNLVCRALKLAGIDTEDEDMITFLWELQQIHDYQEPEQWEDKLRFFAAASKLDVPSFLIA